MYKWQFRSVYIILVSVAVAVVFALGYQIHQKTPKVVTVHPCQGLKGISNCVRDSLSILSGVTPYVSCYHEQTIDYVCEVDFVGVTGQECHTVGIEMIEDDQIPTIRSDAQHSC